MDNWDKEFQLDEYYLELLEEGNLGLQNPEDKSDGEKENVRYIDELRTLERPYPGIRPFKTIEAPIFFGRDGQASKLVEKLDEYNFLAVIGSSGSGKSSLIRAGLIPHLFAGFHGDGTSQWKVAICRPGDDPISNISAALAGVHKNSREKDEILNEARRIRTELIDNPYGLLDIGNEILDGNGKLLIIIDQFEELFRYQREVNATDSHHFVSLLMNAVEDLQEEVYIAITMRSEYLGDCVHFSGLTEAINKGQYLVPRLNRSEIKAAIQGPAQMAGTELDSVLVNKLVSKIGDNMDQLPILQHALMRTYEFWKKDTPEYEKAREQLQLLEKGDPEHESLSSLIRLPMIMSEHYDQSGGMDRAIGDHADEVVGSLTPKQYQIAKCIFQRITDKSSDDRGIRRPSYLLQLHKVAEYLNGKYVLKNQIVAKDTSGAEKITVSNADVNEVIEILRHEDNAFLMPPNAVSLENNPVIDISHESIMRNWRTLKSWIDEELRDGGLYSRLDQSRRDKIRDDERGTKHVYLSGAILADLKNASENYGKNPAWAARYNPIKSASYKSLLEENGELDYKSTKGKNRYYPSKTDEAVYQLNIDYFEECVAAEAAAILALTRRRRTFVAILGSAFLISLSAFVIFFIKNSQLEDDKKDLKVKTGELRRDRTKFKNESTDLSDSLERKEDTLQYYERTIEIKKDSLEVAIELADDRIKSAEEREVAARFREKEAQRREAQAIKDITDARHLKDSIEGEIASIEEAIADARTYLVFVRDSTNNVIADLDSVQREVVGILSSYLTYDEEVINSDWYQELDRAEQIAADSLLYGYYKIPTDIVEKLSLELNSYEVPEDILLSLQLSGLVKSPSLPFRHSMDEIALAKLASDINKNEVTESVLEESLEKVQQLDQFNFLFNEGEEGDLSWSNNGTPLLMMDGNLISLNRNSVDTLVAFDDATMIVREQDATTNRVLVGRREDEGVRTFEETESYFIYEPDPLGNYQRVNDSLIKGYYVARNNSMTRIITQYYDSLYVYDENGTVQNVFPREEYEGGIDKYKISNNGDYLVTLIDTDEYDQSIISIRRIDAAEAPAKTIEIKGRVQDFSFSEGNSGIYMVMAESPDIFQLRFGDSIPQRVYQSREFKRTKDLNFNARAIFTSPDGHFSAISGFNRIKRPREQEDGFSRGYGMVLIYNHEEKKINQVIHTANSRLVNAEFSSDNKKMASLIGGDVFVWNTDVSSNQKPTSQQLLSESFYTEITGIYGLALYNRNDNTTVLEAGSKMQFDTPELIVGKAYLSELEGDTTRASEYAEQAFKNRGKILFSTASEMLARYYEYKDAPEKVLEMLANNTSVDRGFTLKAEQVMAQLAITEKTTDSLELEYEQQKLNSLLDELEEIEDILSFESPTFIYARIIAGNKIDVFATLEGEPFPDNEQMLLESFAAWKLNIPEFMGSFESSLTNENSFISDQMLLLRARLMNSGKFGSYSESEIIEAIEIAINEGNFQNYNYFNNLKDFDNLIGNPAFDTIRESLKNNFSLKSIRRNNPLYYEW